MTNALQMTQALDAAVIHGDLSKLNPAERIVYYKKVCESVGLNPLTKPFEYMRLNGKEVLYAKRDAADQLRKIHGVSITISARELLGEVYVVTARAKDKQGREDESTGAVAVGGLKGDNLANAYLKAETKAKRRVTLSICGLGLLDETEVDTIPNVQKVPVEAEVTQPIPAIEAAPVEAEKAESSIGAYVFPRGKYQGKRMDSLDVYELENYRAWMQRQDNPGPVLMEMMSAIQGYLSEREFQRK